MLNLRWLRFALFAGNSERQFRALYCTPYSTSSPRAKGVGKEEKNPLWAVHAPGHTDVFDSHRLKTS
ncbi:hypothetical protein EVAR_44941_1 [Eumeta japonica]|uniref:Uncharacterized protein n=1 Tax=Eumeta variegata TaxID=151549 RepID=A0A4C1W3Z1_EUMVA|nr:hypothetical protein EVAR_44941_1 [Eumeta japonica]